jgi:multicomponent K+:H+ antiporter subunit C
MSLELMLSGGLGVLTAAGVWLMLRARVFDLILGLTLLSYAVNVFIFLTGRVRVGRPPIVDGSTAPTLAGYADPLPQALVLTAIVIGFAMTALILVIALRARAETGSDHVDGAEPGDESRRAPGRPEREPFERSEKEVR